jgi:predicted acylesterase/phospholipase RssA
MRCRFAVVGSAHPRHLPYCRLEEAAIPLRVVCAEFSTGAEVVLSQGPIIKAVLASTAIPRVFPPVQIGDFLLVDGAVAGGTPIGTAIRLGARRIIVLPCGFACSGGFGSTTSADDACHHAHGSEAATSRILAICPFGIGAYPAATLSTEPVELRLFSDSPFDCARP